MSPQGRSVLVVDSDACILELLGIALTGMGFLPRTTTSAAAALDASRMHHPDFALVDMDVDGWADLVASLRTMNPQIRCCLVDAGVEGALSPDQCARLGISHRFCKPFTLEQLQNALEQKA